jgi:hypothetical protein
MFAWCPADMPGIPRELAEHELKIFPNTKPVKQSMRRYNPEKAKSMGEEINRLLEAKFIREIKEATWLSHRSWWRRRTPRSTGCASISQP